MPNPGLAPHEADLVSEEFPVARLVQIRQKSRIKDDTVNADTFRSCCLVQRDQVRCNGFEIDTEIFEPALRVKFNAVSKLVSHVCRQWDRPALGIAYRNHEIHGKAVLVRAMRLDAATFLPTAFPVHISHIGA